MISHEHLRKAVSRCDSPRVENSCFGGIAASVPGHSRFCTGQQQVYTESVLWETGVNVVGPLQDASFEVFDILESPGHEDAAGFRTSGTAATVNDDGLILLGFYF